MHGCFCLFLFFFLLSARFPKTRCSLAAILTTEPTCPALLPAKATARQWKEEENGQFADPSLCPDTRSFPSAGIGRPAVLHTPFSSRPPPAAAASTKSSSGTRPSSAPVGGRADAYFRHTKNNDEKNERKGGARFFCSSISFFLPII
jgi:hypothetical protein